MISRFAAFILLPVKKSLAAGACFVLHVGFILSAAGLLFDSALFLFNSATAEFNYKKFLFNSDHRQAA